MLPKEIVISRMFYPERFVVDAVREVQLRHGLPGAVGEHVQVAPHVGQVEPEIMEIMGELLLQSFLALSSIQYHLRPLAMSLSPLMWMSVLVLLLGRSTETVRSVMS